MNGAPLLEKIASALAECRLEAVLIGNAAAALHGAPVTTIDFDFMFRKTEVNLVKIKRVASCLGGTVQRPYYPASGLYRVVNESADLQVDFMSFVHGVRSLSSLKSRARRVTFGRSDLLVADLADIIASKRAADRPRDRSVLEILEKTLNEAQKDKTHKG
ncbi:MAG TPA: hypothetical protein VFC26_05490 [Verrucomicrobiae bacterium]|nr:hypothetical protein [Verrucomicrobiae bacterium]